MCWSRTVLTCPYAKSSHLLELLACLCEQYEAPANLSEILCQTLSWAVRCESRATQQPADVPAQGNLPVISEAKDSDDITMRPSAQYLARCIETVFHTLPAVVRHVHAENMVPWALDCLAASPPRNLELRRALLGTLATSLCESPSLVPKLMHLPGESLHPVVSMSLPWRTDALHLALSLRHRVWHSACKPATLPGYDNGVRKTHLMHYSFLNHETRFDARAESSRGVGALFQTDSRQASCLARALRRVSILCERGP